MSIPSNYTGQVYAALLGKAIGVQYGAPIEGWTAERIWQELGELRGYIKPYRYFRPDDDLSGPLIFIRALEDFTASEALTPQQIGDTWLNYLGDGHCTLWWGGYGVSTEHTAYVNLANGIPAPRSGSIAQNGHLVAEQIGGQIFIDTWGLICPGDPERAARYAAKAASVSHDGDGLYGGVFIAALEARAFYEKEPIALLEATLPLIPADSTYARVVRDVLGWRRVHTGWRDCFAEVQARYGYDKYGGGCHIIPNAAVVVMALAYSDGDFSRALHVANMAGWDTDCNVGNVGCIMGLVAGLDGIDAAAENWRRGVHDHVLTSQILGSECILDLPNAALYIANLGRQVMGQGEPEAPKGGRKYHFALRGSTHSWEARRDPGQAAVCELRNLAVGGTRMLEIDCRRLSAENQGVITRRTFFSGNDFEQGGYSPELSPTIYPGQNMSAQLHLAAGDDVSARLFVTDFRSGAPCYGPTVALRPGEPVQVTFEIPRLDDAILGEAGVALSAPAPTAARVLLDWVDWSGAPDCGFDFRRPDALLGWSHLRGRWERRSDHIFGSHFGGPAELYTGLLAWQDYSFEVRLQPHIGERHRLLFRVRGAQRSYSFGLAPGGQVAFEKNWQGYRETATAPFAWELQRAYTLRVNVRGNHMTGYVDGIPLLEWTDPEASWPSGMVGLGLQNGRTNFMWAKLSPG